MVNSCFALTKQVSKDFSRLVNIVIPDRFSFGAQEQSWGEKAGSWVPVCCILLHPLLHMQGKQISPLQVSLYVCMHLLVFMYIMQLHFFLINIYERNIRALGSSAVLGKVVLKPSSEFSCQMGDFGADGPGSGCAQPFSGSS